MLERHAKLVLRLAGGNLVMGLGVDVGVHAKRDARGLPTRVGHFAQIAKLGFRFHVEGEDARVEREGHLFLGLADAGEGDPLRRHIHGERPAKFAFGDHVHAGAKLRQGGEHAEIGIGLDGIADERVGRVREGVGEHPVVALERCRGIAIERSPDGVGQRGEVDVFGVEYAGVGNAAPVVEMVHGRKRGLID